MQGRGPADRSARRPQATLPCLLSSASSSSSTPFSARVPVKVTDWPRPHWPGLPRIAWRRAPGILELLQAGLPRGRVQVWHTTTSLLIGCACPAACARLQNGAPKPTPVAPALAGWRWWWWRRRRRQWRRCCWSWFFNFTTRAAPALSKTARSRRCSTAPTGRAVHCSMRRLWRPWRPRS